jgi:hypothetical protein
VHFRDQGLGKEGKLLNQILEPWGSVSLFEAPGRSQKIARGRPHLFVADWQQNLRKQAFAQHYRMRLAAYRV